MDRLAHFTINVNHIAGKHLALTDYLSKNPRAPPQADEAYDEECVINNIVPHYKFISKYGCHSNHVDQSQNGRDESEHNTNNKPRSSDAREQTAIDCLKLTADTRISQNLNNSQSKMDARAIDHLETIDSSQETTDLIRRWREVAKPGIYRMTGGKKKKYQEPKILRSERKVIEERLQQIIDGRQQPDLRQRIGPQQRGGFQPQTSRAEQWTVDPFWDLDQPTPAQLSQQEQPDTSSSSTRQERNTPIPMEEGEIHSETDQDPSVLKVPAKNWSQYVGVKSVQYVVKRGHAPKIVSEENKNWDLEQAVGETEKNFSTDLQLLMTETTNDPNLLKTLVCLERQQHDLIPEEYQPHKKKLSSQFGLVFIEDKIIVPKNLQKTIISLLRKGHPAINKMSLAARHFWWPKMTDAIQKKCETCIPCKMSGKSIKPNILYTEKNNLPPLNSPNGKIQLDFVGPITESNRRFYILLSMDRFSKWPVACFCTSTDGETALKF